MQLKSIWFCFFLATAPPHVAEFYGEGNMAAKGAAMKMISQSDDSRDLQDKRPWVTPAIIVSEQNKFIEKISNTNEINTLGIAYGPS